MGLFEFLMLLCFGFSWPFSIAKSIRSKSTAGKSLGFMLLVELGYVFGIVHKILYSRNWVLWVYVALFCVVAVDVTLYFVNARRERRAAGKVASEDSSPASRTFKPPTVSRGVRCAP